MSMHWDEGEQGFRAEWEYFRPTAAPIGWVLREAGAEPWLRLHSLPESKRYAENDRERQLIVDRGNCLAQELLGNNEQCWQVAIVSKERSNVGYYRTDDDFNIYLHAAVMIWKTGEQNGHLSAIADDESRMLWMNRRTGRILLRLQRHCSGSCPYYK